MQPARRNADEDEAADDESRADRREGGTSWDVEEIRDEDSSVCADAGDGYRDDGNEEGNAKLFEPLRMMMSRVGKDPSEESLEWRDVSTRECDDRFEEVDAEHDADEITAKCRDECDER